ncbi:MAG: hypothetical protein VX278_11145, partial [Myxococcota bacterium]|nr:hypothetical protein [Myxococcota bacterium]
SSLTAMPGTPISMQYQHTLNVKNPLDRDVQRETISDLQTDELQELMREAWLGFYLRPKPMLQLSIDSWRSGSFREGLRMAVGLGRWALR